MTLAAIPRRQPRRSTIRIHAWVGCILAAGILAMLGAGAVLWMRCGVGGCPDIARLDGYMPERASVIKDRTGQELARLLPSQRAKVRLHSLPDYVAAAFVAMEDQRFWRHHGIDWRRVVGAAAHDIHNLGIEQGSSTITMQLARNVFSERLPASKRTMSRKFAEGRVAQMIEDRYSKEEILELYLNEIYFGHGAYGIEAASREYFGKHATQLTLDEAALLAGLPRAPTVLNPRTNLELALKGRRLALRRLREQKLITPAQAAAAGAMPVRLKRGAPGLDLNAPYFIQVVRQQLEDSLADAINTDGYTIETTLDSKLQHIAEDEVNRQLVAIESGMYGTFPHTSYAGAMRDSVMPENGTDYLQTAVVFMDPRNGDVRALIGGRDYQDSQFNRALNGRRQAASLFKPFVFAAAVAAGYPPSLRLSDQPMHLMVGGRPWSPENQDHVYHDVVTMRQALAASSNVATVRLGAMVGLNRVIEQARRAGLSGRIPRVPSVVLGSMESTPLELTAAYAALATPGSRSEPRLITRVLDAKGKVVWEQRPVATAGLDPAVAYMVTTMLRDVIDSGTARSVRGTGYLGGAAGKTGTSNDVADLWFIGYTPNLVGTIWLGFDHRLTVVREAQGGELAAPVWGRIMARLGEPSPDWAIPRGVAVRRMDAAGRVYGEACPNAPAHVEYFLARVAPAPSC